ncbi:MAG: C40 family peptidase [Clostridiales bacterium]|nr:C40 family peptidase [Clostridiales bacterium]
MNFLRSVNTAGNIGRAALCLVMLLENNGLMQIGPEDVSSAPVVTGTGYISEDESHSPDYGMKIEQISCAVPNEGFIYDETPCYIADGCIAFEDPVQDPSSATTLASGTEVTRTGIGTSMDRVVTEDGREYYVVKFAARPSEPEEAEEEEEEIDPGQQIADIAVSMIGTRYQYASASEDAVDCSGLVVYCYAQLGVELPHYSGSLCDVGTEVSEEDLRPGDIICWNNGGGHCGHVGIYVGDGQCVDARGHRDGVIYADLDLHPILTIRRIFEV